MSDPSPDIPRHSDSVQPIPRPGTVPWFTTNWKVGLAFIYSFIVVADFVVFPIYIGLQRTETIVQISAIPGISDEVRGTLIVNNMKPYAPKTLMGAGMFHLAFGALLTGATLKDKLKGGH